ncbi:MAG: hypothetical protein L6R28_09735 [Planctomycetes bacterium]|nr:hypothetical protein [Planctomycetota bacterium]
MKSAARFVSTILLAAMVATATRAEEPAPDKPPAPAAPSAPKYHALTLKDGRELKGTYAAGTLTLYNDAGKAMGSVAVKEDEIAKKEELPWPFAAATEKPGDAAAGKRMLHVLTMKDGRELKGVYDKAQGSIQMFASNGKPMGTLEVKEENVAKVEEAPWPYPDTQDETQKKEANAPPKSAEPGVTPEVLRGVEDAAQALNTAIATFEKAKAEWTDFGRKYHGKKVPQEDVPRLAQLKHSLKSAFDSATKRRDACRATFDSAFEKYKRQGGKKAKTAFVPKY